MTFQAYLEHLKNKPEHIRKQIALGTASGITLIIFVFWIGSFTAIGQNAQQSVAQTVAKAGSPAESLTASVGGLFDDIKNLLFTPRTVSYSAVEVAPGK